MGAATGRYTSSIFRALYAWEAALLAESWPAHGTTGATPSVDFGDTDPDQGQESIVIQVSSDAGGASMEWVQLSKPGREERFTLRAVIRSNVPNTTTAKTVMERLEQLADVVQESVFDTTTVNNPVIALDFDGELRIGGVSAVVPDVYPDPSGSGWFGTCIVDVALAARL